VKEKAMFFTVLTPRITRARSMSPILAGRVVGRVDHPEHPGRQRRVVLDDIGDVPVGEPLALDGLQQAQRHARWRGEPDVVDVEQVVLVLHGREAL
jgi:hypothetical protein